MAHPINNQVPLAPLPEPLPNPSEGRQLAGVAGVRDALQPHQDANPPAPKKGYVLTFVAWVFGCVSFILKKICLCFFSQQPPPAPGGNPPAPGGNLPAPGGNLPAPGNLQAGRGHVPLQREEPIPRPEIPPELEEPLLEPEIDPEEEEPMPVPVATIRRQVQFLNAIGRLSSVEQDRIYFEIGRRAFCYVYPGQWLRSYVDTGRREVQENPLILESYIELNRE